MLLSQPGLDVNLADNNGYTALHHAIACDNFEGLKMMLAHPRMKSHNAKAKDGQTPLDIAIQGHSMGCIKELVKEGVKPRDIGVITPYR